MSNDQILADLGVYTSRAPRYTSYPTAAQFHNGVSADFMETSLRKLDPSVPASVYVHIPFCERLCWFCACRTQGTQSQSPVKAYLAGVFHEIRRIKELLPAGVEMGRLHWGGGTPTILQPDDMMSLSETIKETFTPAEQFEFSVEIDPTLVDRAKISALSSAGMNRASIGIQDFDLRVQNAIGRQQSVEQTASCVTDLRAAGISSLNADILYGLPHQTADSVEKTLSQVLSLEPDRIALYGYAHVPWMAKRQQMIDEAALPGGESRRGLFSQMAMRLENSGYRPIGIDHFAKPGDTLAQAADTGHLRRNFQGYTTDRCQTLIGLGASAISKFAEGYAQNAPRSSHYLRMVTDAGLATQRGVEFTDDDKIRARAIEMVMCDFTLSIPELEAEFGPVSDDIIATSVELTKRYQGLVEPTETGFTIRDKQRALARLVARAFDAYSSENGRFSQVS